MYCSHPTLYSGARLLSTSSRIAILSVEEDIGMSSSFIPSLVTEWEPFTQVHSANTTPPQFSRFSRFSGFYACFSRFAGYV